MLGSFRRLSKSKVGPIVLGLFLALIVASFALADISNVTGGMGGASSSTLVEVGKADITDRDISRALETRLQQVRQQNPDADYSALAADFEPLLQSLIDMRALEAFAGEHGFQLSKRLIDAEIANIPGARGLDGQFSQAAYQQFLAQQRMSDQEVRTIIATGLLQQMMLAPIASNARIPVGVATPYASMLLETRSGEVATVPVAAFRAGLNPTDADIQRYYAANRNRYMVPEQRILRMARIGPAQVASVAATDQEIAGFYRANQATYAARDVRVISQAVVPDKAAADAIAARARGGATFAAAAAPAGLSAEDISVGPQTRAEFASLAGEQVAAAAFGAGAGDVVGPVQSDLGWHVVKVDSVRTEGGRTFEQARAEIAERLTADKRKNALADLVASVEDAIAEGSNFDEAAAKAKLEVTQTPLIAANGTSRSNPDYRFPADLAPVLQTGFQLAPNDDAEVATLPDDAGFVLVAPAEVVPSAPAPLAAIREQVRNDWINGQAQQRARAVASAIAAKAARNVPLERAVAEAQASLPEVRDITMRRLDMAQFGEQVPPAIRMLFNLTAGKSQIVASPQGDAFQIVRVDTITPGNALTQPALISRVQSDFQRGLSDEYAAQFLAAVRAAVGVERNEKAIAEARTRITGN